MENKGFDAVILERKIKQQFLTEEILQRNYDTKKFLEFCERKKSSDIDEWTFDELDACVQEFKAQSGKKSEVKIKATPYSEPVTNPKSATRPKPIIDNEGVIKFTHDQTEKTFGKMNEVTISIEQPLMNELSAMQNAKIIVCNPELVDPGFLSTKFYVFVVNTQPINWIVKRKLEEFLWIREMLQASFPGVFIPAMHKSTKNKLETKGLFKRQVIYSNFLNNVVSVPLLRTSPYLLAFLKEQDLKMLKPGKKPGKIREVGEIKNLEGSIVCVYEEIADKYENLNSYLAKTDKTLGELLEKLKKLIVDSIHLSEAIKGYAGIVREMQVNNAAIKNNDAALTYKEIEEALLNWSEHIMKNTTNLYEDIKLPFKIYKNELITLKELIKERDSYLLAYKSSIGKPTAVSIKDIFGYFNYSCLVQSQKVIADVINQLTSRLVVGFTKKSEEITQFHMIWGNLISGLA